MLLKKKKSLVGWANDNWVNIFRRYEHKEIGINSILTPTIRSNNPKNKDRRNQRYNRRKVRITIEEV